MGSYKSRDTWWFLNTLKSSENFFLSISSILSDLNQKEKREKNEKKK